jgi:hypothetical protein
LFSQVLKCEYAVRGEIVTLAQVIYMTGGIMHFKVKNGRMVLFEV